MRGMIPPPYTLLSPVAALLVFLRGTLNVCGLFQACTILEPKSKRAGKDPAQVFRIEVQAYAVGSSARVEGTASKTVDGVKFIVRKAIESSRPCSARHSALH